MTDVSWNTILLLILRHFATVAGGWLVHKGYADASAQDAVIGSIMTLAAVGGSWWQKSGQAAALGAAHRAYEIAASRATRLEGQIAGLRKPPAPSVQK